MNIPRIGHGYDVHRLTEGRALVLGGVTVPWEKGLLGHSDADVLLHALMDALLGAAALGDIGHLFPDSDERYKGADSRALLREVKAVLDRNGFSVGNVDMTLVAQRPKIAPYLEQMRRNIAADLNVPVDAVSVKATTEEGLGFTGDGSGMSAYASALIVQNLCS
jgi:2-C-methyl-D-erythritol 2,4-cyclodiphosphate synthase